MSAVEAVRAIPQKIEESLSALRNPANATETTHQAAVAKLKNYEKALGISSDPSVPYGARIDAVTQAAEREVLSVLPKQLSESEISALSLDAISQATQQAQIALEKLTKLSAVINDETLSTLPSTEAATPMATAAGAYVELPDSRDGFAAHRAFIFSVAPSKGTVLDELKELLGKDAADQLVKDWGNRCNLNQRLEKTEVGIFLDSNNKARNRDYANRNDKTTQEEDFAATGKQFAEDLALTLLCARVRKKFKDRDSLSEGEKDLYQKLKDGVIRSCSGALDIDDDGRLRANNFYARSSSYGWASCSRRSPELK
jgi:hypothetical protein